VLSAAAFAGAMLVATLIHYDKFNHGDAPTIATIAFYGWVIVYVVSPFVVFGLWLRNQRVDRRETEPGEVVLPRSIVLGARLFGAAAVAGAVVFFASPQVGIGALLLSLDPRWSSWRLLIQTFFVATAFLFVGAARAFDDFDTGNAATWLYLGGLAAADVALLLLYRRYEAIRT
jgi:hypothetical protein